MSLNFDDFQKQDVKFDIVKLQKAYKELLAIKGFTSIEGISNFGAISLHKFLVIQTLLKVTRLEGYFGLNLIPQVKKL